MNGEVSPPARLLLVDDSDLVREGMRAMLAKEPDVEVVGEAADGWEGVGLCRSLRPDLVLMDVRMPRMDGLAATREIKAEHPLTSVLMVTIHDSPEYLMEAIKAGAAGYVLKDSTKQELLGAVRRVLQGESPLNQELALRLIQELSKETKQRAKPLPESDGDARGGKPAQPPVELFTVREFEVLRLLVRGQTNRQVAQGLKISLSTVKTHVQQIIAKLKVSDRTQAAVRAVELGLLSDREEGL